MDRIIKIRITQLSSDRYRLIHIIIWSGILLTAIYKAGTSRLPSLILQLMALLLLFISILYGIRRKEWQFSYHPIDLLMIAFVILAAISTFRVHYQHNAQRCFFLILAFAIFYFHIAEDFSIKDFERLWWGMIGLGIIESVIVLYQFIFLNQSRPPGTFYNPNHLACFLACLFMFIIARLVFNPFFRRFFIFKILIIVFLGIGILMTQSRGGFFALFGGGIGFLLLIKSKKRVFCFLIAAFILLLVIPNPAIQRIKQVSTYDVYAYSRWSMWKSALTMLRDYPVFGIGLGNFGYFSYRYAFPVKNAWAKYARVARYAHNEFLHIGSEMGIFGILFFLSAIIVVFFYGIKRMPYDRPKKENHGPAQGSADRKAILIGLLTLLFHSCVDFIFHIPPILILLLILTLWIRQLNLEAQEQAGYRFCLSGRGLSLILLLIPLLLAWIPIKQYLGYRRFNKAKGRAIIQDIKYMEEAIEMDFGCAPYHNSLGGAYFRIYGSTADSNALERGLQEAKLAQTLNPDDYRFPLSLGSGYLDLYLIFPSKRDILDKAGKEFRRSIFLSPYLYEGYLGLGRVLLYQNRPKKAVDMLEKVVSLEPYSMSGHYWRGLAFEALGDSKSARAEYEEILAIKGLGLEKRAYTTYEKSLIDFDMSRLDTRMNAF